MPSFTTIVAQYVAYNMPIVVLLCINIVLIHEKNLKWEFGFWGLRRIRSYFPTVWVCFLAVKNLLGGFEPVNPTKLARPFLNLIDH